MKYLLSTFLFAFISSFLSGQTKSVTIQDKSNKPIAFASVTVYQNDSMIADLLSDVSGKINLNQNEGVYTLKVRSYGYADTSIKLLFNPKETYRFHLSNQTKSIESIVVVSSSSSTEYAKSKAVPLSRASGMKDSRRKKTKKEVKYFDSPLKKESVDTDMDEMTIDDVIIADEEIMESEPTEDIIDLEFTHDLSPEFVPEKNKEVSSGILTGGEINDFSKWTLWFDESAQLLSKQQKFWDFAPQGRYTIQLKNKSGFPRVDKIVKLVNDKGLTVWRARTDNTGKAELWAEVDSVFVKDLKGLQVIVVDGEQSQLIDIEYQQRFGFRAIEIDAPCQTSNQVDIAFVVDATGSMGDEINYLKQEMNDVMYKSKIAYPELAFRYANIFYRDTRDAYLYKKQDFTRTLSESSAFINQQAASGGGDYEEAVEVGLEQAIDSLAWSDHARARLLFVILDAPPHNTYDTRKKMKALAKKAASKGIRIIPIAASGINKNTELLMRSMALCTNGTYLFITDHSGVGNSHIKPTTDHYQVKSLNTIMVETIVNQIEVMDCAKAEQLMQDSLLMNKDTFIAIDTIQVVENDSLNKVDTTMSLAFDWSYYPNPTNGIVYFKSNISIPKVYIYDLRGTLVQVIENTNPETIEKIDLRQYANGTYLIHFEYQKKKYSGKVILIKELN